MSSRSFGIRRGALVAVFVAAVSMSFFLAVQLEGLFEISNEFGDPGAADIAGSNLQDGCDWADLFDADPSPEEFAEAARACGGVGAAFVADPLSAGKLSDETTFVKGSSKNDEPPSSWQWETGGSPTKDDLSNVYTFATLNDKQELIIYAGLERLSGSGSSHVDFEFNQTPIVLDKEPPCGDDGSSGPGDGAPCEFAGEKAEGDLLIVMDFDKGGDLASVDVRRWDGFQYTVIETGSGEGCNAADTVCAFNNSSPVDGGPWDNFDSKGNVVSSLEENAFTEIGVNVTKLFGSTPCFVSVNTKTRSSSSYNSVLKDFAQTSFEICSFTITKGGSPQNPDQDRSKVGDDFIFLYTLENTGAATLYCDSITDSLLGDITSVGCPSAAGQDAEKDCSVLLPGEICEFIANGAIPIDADDPFDSSVTAVYLNTQPSLDATDATDPTDAALVAVSDDDAFSLNLFQPSVDVEKTGDTLSTPGNLVDYVITVTNTSSADSPPLANASITDTLLGDLLDPANPFVTASDCADTLEVGATCTIEASREVLADDPDPLPNTVSVLYNPAGGYPNEIRDSDEHVVDLVYPDFSISITASPLEAQIGDVITYTYVIENTGDVAITEISVVDTLLGDLSGLFPDRLEPGESATIIVERTVLATDPKTLTNEVTVTYQVEGLVNQITRAAAFTVEIIIPCAKSPGFWQGGEGVPKWDEPTDPIAVEAGFTTGTVFPWLDPSLAGSTYLDVLNLPALGDVTRQLSFKYIAARLNQAAFNMRQSTALLLDQIDVYFASNPVGSDPQGAAYDEGQALLSDLNAYFFEVGEADCPPSDQF